jgi:hypothetical protein
MLYIVLTMHTLPDFSTLEYLCQFPSFLLVTIKKEFLLVTTVAGVVQRIWVPITKQVSEAACCPSYGETKPGESQSRIAQA